MKLNSIEAHFGKIPAEIRLESRLQSVTQANVEQVSALPWLVSKKVKLSTFSSFCRQISGEFGSLNEVKYLIEEGDDYLQNDSLPIEFFLRELQELDLSDDKAILNFSREYGILTSPYFGAPQAFSAARHEKKNYNMILPRAYSIGKNSYSFGDLGYHRYSPLEEVSAGPASLRDKALLAAMRWNLLPGAVEDATRALKSNNRKGYLEYLDSLWDDAEEIFANFRLEARYLPEGERGYIDAFFRPCFHSEIIRRELASRGELTGGVVSLEEVRLSLGCLRESLSVAAYLDFFKGNNLELIQHVASSEKSYPYITDKLIVGQINEWERLKACCDSSFIPFEEDYKFRECLGAIRSFFPRSCITFIDNYSLFSLSVAVTGLPVFPADNSAKIKSPNRPLVGAEGSLAGGIFAQFFSTASTEVKWKECATCKQLHKRKRYARVGRYRFQGSAWCSEKCEKQYQRKRSKEIRAYYLEEVLKGLSAETISMNANTRFGEQRSESYHLTDVGVVKLVDMREKLRRFYLAQGKAGYPVKDIVRKAYAQLGKKSALRDESDLSRKEFKQFIQFFDDRLL